MDAVQMQKDLFLIKEMIERTKKSTAESGSLMVYIGVFTAVVTLVIGVLELYSLNAYVMPAIIGMTVVNALIGYVIATKDTKQAKVVTYAKTIFWQTWIVCGLTAVLVVFLFPFLKIYPFSAIPVLTAMILGIGVYVTGVIFETPFIRWSSLAWWVAAVLLALINSPYEFLILMAAITLGWTMPGIYLNRVNKNRSA